MPNPLKIAFSAGELSGDEHLAAVIREVQKLQPNAQFQGMAGRNVRALGVETLVDSEVAASVMGFAEVVFALPRVVRAFKELESMLKRWRPDVLVVVDFADFNMRLVKKAHKLGIRTVYFIPPQVWAWRSGRVKAITENVDVAATIFPFEVEFYKKNGSQKAHFVGHPFANKIVAHPERRLELLSKLGLDASLPTAVVLPGSRSGEVARHAPAVRESLDLLRQKNPAVQAIIVVAPTQNPQVFADFAGIRPWVRIVHGGAVDYMSVADVGLLKSGTSNLQAAFCGLPFVMFYRANPLSAALVKHFVRSRDFSIVNIIRPNSITELLQHECVGVRLANEAHKILENPAEQQRIRKNLAEVVERLVAEGGRTAYENVARILLA